MTDRLTPALVATLRRLAAQASSARRKALADRKLAFDVVFTDADAAALAAAIAQAEDGDAPDTDAGREHGLPCVPEQADVRIGQSSAPPALQAAIRKIEALPMETIMFKGRAATVIERAAVWQILRDVQEGT